MKTFVRFFMVAICASFLLSSCVKTVVGTVNDPIVGSWVLSDASTGNANGWKPLYTGLENGVFTFYTNGSAVYDDGFTTFLGSWAITTVSTGYYDYYGNYYTDYHDAMQVSLRSSGGSTINLYFDDVNFNNNNYFTGTYYRNYSVERYSFKRY